MTTKHSARPGRPAQVQPLTRRQPLKLLAAALFAGVVAQAHAAAPYPERAIRLVVPFEPGGSTDIVARMVAQKLGEQLGQSIVVENKGGAGGNIGTDQVVKARPDGYTLLWANVAPVAINTHLYAKMPYDPDRDLAPIGLATVFPNVLVVNPKFPASNLKEFMEKAQGELKNVSYASAGNGSSTHLGAEWMNTALKTSWLHVPYKGGGPALLAVASGQVDMYFSSVPAAIGYLKNGTLRAIGVTSREESATLPGVPSLASVVPDYEALNWNGLMAPAGTPEDVLDKLNTELRRAMQSEDLKKKLLDQGAEPADMTRPQFTEYIKSESEKWKRIIEVAKARVQ